MIALLSPAKTLDFQTPLPSSICSTPRFLSSSKKLVDELKQYAPAQLSQLMKLSDKLSALNSDRFKAWRQSRTISNDCRPAIHAFKGDVYTGLAIDTFSANDLDYSQQHLRILSGLYGLLKPLDLIRAYRLEMGTKLSIGKHQNLYQFWQNTLTDQLNDDLAESQSSLLVNLASNEYFKAINPQKLSADIITPIFKDYKNGTYKIISFYAKKARGMMARFILTNRLDQIDQLKDFDEQGYHLVESDVTNRTLVFHRRLD